VINFIDWFSDAMQKNIAADVRQQAALLTESIELSITMLPGLVTEKSFS
jgi:hypothetical protein